MFKTSLKTFSALCALLVAFTSGGQAQESMPLSLDQARQHALEHNKNLANAGLAVDEASLMLRETIAQGLPQVNATIDYQNFFGSTASFGDFPQMEIEFSPTSNLGVSVGQLIFSGSYIVGIQTARLYREMSNTSLEKSALEIKAQVSQAYYLALISMESQQIVDANLENMREMLTRTRTMVDVGVAEEVDFDQLSVQVAMLEDAQRAAGRQVELAMNMLRLHMGLTADTQIELTDNLEQIIETTNYRESLTESFALNESPDFRLMQLQTDIAEKQVNMQRAAYLPSITGFYSFTEKLLKPEFDLTPNHVIGLNIEIPVFSSGARRARVSQARVNQEMALNQRELLVQQLSIQEKQLRFNLSNSIEQYESQLSNLEVARRVINSINNKFEQGLVSSLDLTTANSNYLQAENSYISALMQLMDAHLELEKLLNTL